MDTTTATRVLAATRLAYGAGLVALPGRLALPWIGSDADRPATRVALRALGVRDAALGAGALAYAGDDARLRPWLAVAIASDLVDMAATLAAPGNAMPASRRWPVAAIAGLAAAAGAALHRSLDR